MAGPIRIAILANGSQARREITSTANTASSKFSSMGKAMALRAGAVGLAVAGAAAVKFGVDAVSAASSAQQSLGATETVFGKFAKTVVRDSNKAATQFGLSANEYRENANLIGSLLKNQGVELDQLGGKTKKMVGTASDLAATFGGTTTEAVQALGSAFKGEFDPLEKYGISLKQSTVNAEAMRVANVKTTSAFNSLTVAQQTAAKQQATTNLINQQSAASSGAFAKESGTLAHQQQVLAAQFSNVKVMVGNALLPILTTAFAFVSTTVIPVVRKFITEMKTGQGTGGQFASAMGKVKSAFEKAFEIIKPVLEFIKNNKTVVATFATVILTVVAATKAWSIAQVAINIALSANPIGLVVIAIAALAAGVVYAYKKSETFRGIVDALAGAFLAAIKAVGRFTSAAVEKIGEVVGFVRQIPGKVTSALGDLGGVLLGAGRDLIQGLINGIQEKFQDVQNMLGDLTSKLPDWKGPPAKDKKLLFGAGGLIIQGLIDGITSGESALEKTLEKIAQKIQKALDKRYDAKALKAATAEALKSLKDEFAAAEKLAKKHEQIVEKIKAAKEALKEAKQAAADYALSIKDSIVQFGNLTELGGGRTLTEQIPILDAEGNITGYEEKITELVATSDTIIEDLKKRAQEASEYSQLVAQLTAAGLNDTSIQQLLAAGVEGGLATAKAIAAGGAGAIAEINSLTETITATGVALGASSAAQFFQAGIDAAQGLVDGLKAKEKDIEEMAERLAKKLARAIKKALGIHSPSRVFRSIGRETSKGLVLGLQDVNLIRAGQQMASGLSTGFGTPALDSFNASISTSGQQSIAVTFSAEQLDALTRGRAIQADLDAFRRVGGRAVA